jgi:hypothetical protein
MIVSQVSHKMSLNKTTREKGQIEKRKGQAAKDNKNQQSYHSLLS